MTSKFNDGPIQRLSGIAAVTGKDPGLLIHQFNKWRETSDIGQILSVDNALDACETAAAEGRAMPWEFRVSIKADVPDLDWPVIDVDDGAVWTPKDGRSGPVVGYGRVLPNCCASCTFLVDLPKFGPPECRRLDGPRFDGPRDEMLYHRCRLWKRGRNQAETDRVLNGN